MTEDWRKGEKKATRLNREHLYFSNLPVDRNPLISCVNLMVTRNGGAMNALAPKTNVFMASFEGSHLAQNKLGEF